MATDDERTKDEKPDWERRMDEWRAKQRRKLIIYDPKGPKDEGKTEPPTSG